MRRLHSRLKNWKPIHLCWLFKRLGFPIPPYLIGGGSDFDFVGGRIGNSDRTWAAAQDVDVTDWVKTNDFIVAAQVEALGHNGGNSELRLEWRNLTDGGAWTVLSATGQLKYGATDLVDGNAVIHTEEGISGGAATHEDGRENEGANARTVVVAQNAHEEDQHSVSPADALDGKEYEFRIYDVGDSAVVGTLLCTITMEAGAATEETARVAGRGDLEADKTARLAGLGDLEKISVARIAGLADLEASDKARLAGRADLEAEKTARLAGLGDLEKISVARIAGLGDLEAISTARMAGLADLEAEVAARLAGLGDLEAVGGARFAGRADFETLEVGRWLIERLGWL